MKFDFTPFQPKLTEGEEVLGKAGFVGHVTIVKSPDGSIKPVVEIRPFLGEDGSEPPFLFWLAFAEYAVCIAAQKSEAGYEKAIELIAEGAMSYRHVKKPPISE